MKPNKDEYLKHNLKYDRWGSGEGHHLKSIDLMRHLQEIDFNFFNDYFRWKVGGDGDNGEILMYQLDMYFELQDIKLKNKFK